MSAGGRALAAGWWWQVGASEPPPLLGTANVGKVGTVGRQAVRGGYVPAASKAASGRAPGRASRRESRRGMLPPRKSVCLFARGGASGPSCQHVARGEGAQRHVSDPPCRPRCPSGRGAGGGARGAGGSAAGLTRTRAVHAVGIAAHPAAQQSSAHGACAGRRSGALAGLWGTELGRVRRGHRWPWGHRSLPGRRVRWLRNRCCVRNLKKTCRGRTRGGHSGSDRASGLRERRCVLWGRPLPVAAPLSIMSLSIKLQLKL